jgi:hypothetical protein
VSWDRPAVAAALAQVLTDAVAAADLAVTVFKAPPLTLNAPALVVGFPATVAYHVPAFSVDLATIVVTAMAGIDDPDTADQLTTLAREAIEADSSLGGVVPVAKPVEQRNWRGLNVGGSDFLAVDLAVEIHA